MMMVFVHRDFIWYIKSSKIINNNVVTYSIEAASASDHVY